MILGRLRVEIDVKLPRLKVNALARVADIDVYDRVVDVSVNRDAHAQRSWSPLSRQFPQQPT